MANRYEVKLTSTRESTWHVVADSEDEVYSSSIYNIRDMGECQEDREHDPEVAWVTLVDSDVKDEDGEPLTSDISGY